MDKPVINIIVALLSMFFTSCNNKAESEKHILIVNSAVNEQLFSIKLKKKFHYQEMRVIENNLNDTCMIGLMKVPPGKIGLLYRIEFISDSISYRYFPYKAKIGSLVIEHSFTDE
jgi:hypothetical protein